jgi:hypothetical protein
LREKKLMNFSWKIGWLAAWCHWLLILQNAFGQPAPSGAMSNEVSLNFRVRYVTADAVYFNGGSADGVRPGDYFWVMQNGQKILLLKVKYVATHSACGLLKKEDGEAIGNDVAIKIDDAILCIIPQQEFLARTEPTAQPAATPRAGSPQKKTRVLAAAPKRRANRPKKVDNVLNGQISLQSFGQKDRNPQQFDFLESSAYLRLDFERPAGLPLRLTARARSSRNYRQIGTNRTEQQPALHRVYEIALEYNSSASPVELAVGRTLRYELRGAGYLDGLVLGYRVNEIWKAGVFAGAQPDLYRYEFRADQKKLGGFVQMKTAPGKSAEINFGATAIGQYIRQQVSREYLAAQVDFNAARQLYLVQYFEIDFNRKWRRRMSASALDLSNAYFNATYYPRPSISFGASYDARRLVRTWETHSIVDSLFDQALRQGWRASVAFQPTALVRLALDGGLQKQKGMPNGYSANVSANVANLWRSGIGINARLSYFSSGLSAGYYPGLDLSRSFFGVIYATLGGGAYIYRMGNGAPAQSNPWERLRLDANLTRRFCLSSTIENFHGDTMKFARGFVDLGLRF